MKKTCKKCNEEVEMVLFIRPFKNKFITEASDDDNRLPKYGFHLGQACPCCGSNNGWLKQDDDIVENKFVKWGK